MLYPRGIDVPAPAEGQPLVHFDVSYRQANKPHPTKRRVAANILARTYSRGALRALLVINVLTALNADSNERERGERLSDRATPRVPSV